ncbi:MAG: hypothetical protein FRX48_02554 [Lasallia pustulata]|uniref:Uncharacterized protein n=1 Tax=Lasallia pustulata TaxID=136370 RepID=A0A5M8PZ75_9LECA|nr:MAG: hypothetical protein FRX48_02554 [Lasallia pustulata]
MGYSLAPAPDIKVPNLSRSSSRLISLSTQKDKPFQPREELAPIPSRTGKEVTEIVSFLKDVEPPQQPETRLYSTNEKLKKSTLGTLWKVRRFSAKRQEQLRAALPKRTRLEESIAGAKYLHIAVDQSALKSSANLSLYRANDYRDPAQKRTTVSSPATVPNETPAAADNVSLSMEKPAIPKSQSLQLSDALGISREHPHLLSGEPETKALQNPGKDGAKNVSSSDTLVPRHDNNDRKTKDFAIHSSNVRFELIPAESQRGREPVTSPGSASSSVLDLSAVQPRSSSKNLGRTSNKQIGPIAIEVVTDSAQLPSKSARLSRPPRVPSRQSVHSVSDGLPPPLPRDSQSTRSSMQSASGSLDIPSDSSSGVILSTQSAEYMRAQGIPGQHSSAAMRKPPKPGPAPTRALPSLPEGQDGITMVHRASVDTRSPTIRIEPSPERSLPMEFPSPPRSPSKQQRHSHSDITDNEQEKACTLIKSATVPQPHWALSSNPPKPPPTNQISRQPNQPPSAMSMSPSTIAAWRRRRFTTTTALKRRDLERGRVRHTTHKSLDTFTAVDPSPDPASKHTDTPREESHTSADDDDDEDDTASENKLQRFNDPSSSSRHQQKPPTHPYHHSSLSPIMLIAAQPPTTARASQDHPSFAPAAHPSPDPELACAKETRGSSSPPSSGDASAERSRSRSGSEDMAMGMGNGVGKGRQRRPQTPIDFTRGKVLDAGCEGRGGQLEGLEARGERREGLEGGKEMQGLESGMGLRERFEGEGVEAKSEGLQRERVEMGERDGLEERLERRLLAVERKNRLLEAALLAVIEASAGLPGEGVGGGGRWGGRREERGGVEGEEESVFGGEVAGGVFEVDGGVEGVNGEAG